MSFYASGSLNSVVHLSACADLDYDCYDGYQTRDGSTNRLSFMISIFTPTQMMLF